MREAHATETVTESDACASTNHQHANAQGYIGSEFFRNEIDPLLCVAEQIFTRCLHLICPLQLQALFALSARCTFLYILKVKGCLPVDALLSFRKRTRAIS